MDTLTEYAERMWRGDAAMRGLLADGAPLGVAAPVADGVAVVPGFANVIAFQTADGLGPRVAARQPLIPAPAADRPGRPSGG